MYGLQFDGTPADSTRTMSLALGITFLGVSKVWVVLFYCESFVCCAALSYSKSSLLFPAVTVGRRPALFMRFLAASASPDGPDLVKALKGSPLPWSGRLVLCTAHLVSEKWGPCDKLWKSGDRNDGLKCSRSQFVFSSDLRTNGFAKKL